MRTLIVMGLLAASLQGCGVKQGNTKLLECTACLADDPTRCATDTPVCGDSDNRLSAEAGAKDALCDTLSAADLARRPTPADFKPNPWNKNACYRWPDDAFKVSCTGVRLTCSSVPIH